MGFHGDHGDLMGFHGDLMGFHAVLMVIGGTYKEISW